LFSFALALPYAVPVVALLTDSRRKRGLQEWFLTLQRFHADRVLSIDLETAKSGENSLPPHNSPVS